MTRSPLSSSAMLATTTALLLLLAAEPTTRSVQGSPLRIIGDKERQQQQQQVLELDYYEEGDEDDDYTVIGASDADNLTDLALLDGEDFASPDDENADGEQLPTHSGDGAALFGNWSQEARSAELALFVELVARLLREIRAPNTSQSLSETLSLSSARAAYQRLCSDYFFKHFFGITSCDDIGGGNDVDDSVRRLETEVDASAMKDDVRGIVLRSAAASALDALFGADIDEEDSALLSEEP